MRIYAAVAATLAVLSLVGCGSQSSPNQAGTTGGDAKPDGKSVVGKWRGKVEINPEKKDDPAAKMAEGMAEMFGDFLLEFKDGASYKLTVMGMPTEGTVTMKGADITLTPEKIMGKTVAEFKEMNKGNANSAGDPMVGKVAEDYETITMSDPKKPETQVVFKRDTTKPREIGASSVKGEEEALVGLYGAEIDPKKMTAEDKQMAEAVIPTASLELFHDNTFTMNMMMEMEGTWNATGGKVTLTLKKMNGVEEKPDSGNKPINMTVDGGKLIPEKDGGKEPPFFFVKK